MQRLLASVITLWGVCTLTFVLAHVVPADPARTIAGAKADRETLDRIRKEMHLDRALPVRYALYLGRLAAGDLGRSYVTRQDVATAIVERLPATAFLALTSLSAAMLLGISIGCVSAAYAGRHLDLALLITSVVALSVPVFWLGLLLIYGFAFRVRWFPLGGYGGWQHVALPATALALGNIAYYGRLLHGSLAGVLGADFIRTARAKGVGRGKVYLKHALRNALIPLVTVVGIDLAGLLSGVVLTETVFNWPGIGRLAVDAVFNQDIPMIMGTVLFGGALVVAANIAVDAIYLWIDPRLRHPGGTVAGR